MHNTNTIGKIKRKLLDVTFKKKEKLMKGEFIENIVRKDNLAYDGNEN